MALLTASLRTGLARFPSISALQCSSWLPWGASGVDALVACAADDEGLAAAGSHPRDPFRLLFSPLGAEVFECPNVVHLDLRP